MDSLSQIVLGGAVAAAIAPPQHRRAALLAGAALGTLPDLDSIPIALLTDDPVARVTLHRGASHSLLVLPWVALAIWAWFRSRGGRVAESPVRWFWAILLALVTHPLLDAFTVYGTQLWWPSTSSPVMWSSVFIIDPLYTVWLLAACIAAWWLRERRAAQHWLLAGLLLSSAYLGWSLLAKQLVEREAAMSLAAMGLVDAPMLSVPMPLNTVLWRVIAMTPDGHVEGQYSLLADRGRPFRFDAFGADQQAMADALRFPAGQRLHWFTHGFQRAEVVDGQLVLRDLRMGAEPDYFFSFALAQRDAEGDWQALAPSEQLRPDLSQSFGEQLRQTWTRIWQPADDAHQAAD